MTKLSQDTIASGTVKTAGVVDYIVERIAQEGVTHCFGVAGDGTVKANKYRRFSAWNPAKRGGNS